MEPPGECESGGGLLVDEQKTSCKYNPETKLEAEPTPWTSRRLVSETSRRMNRELVHWRPGQTAPSVATVAFILEGCGQEVCVRMYLQVLCV